MATALKACKHCKASHRKRSAYLACKKRNGPKVYWS